MGLPRSNDGKARFLAYVEGLAFWRRSIDQTFMSEVPADDPL